MPGLSSRRKRLCRNLITSYPLIGRLFLRCLRIIMSKKSWTTLRLKVCVVSDSTLDTGSKVLYVLGYNAMCL